MSGGIVKDDILKDGKTSANSRELWNNAPKKQYDPGDWLAALNIPEAPMQPKEEEVQPQVEPSPPTKEEVVEEVSIPSPTKAEEDDDFKSKKPPKKPGEFPKCALECGGLIGEIMSLTEQITFARNPQLAWAGAVAFMSFIMARGYQTSDGTHSAMQILGLAPSGCGKEAARDTIRTLVKALDMTQHLCDGFGSGEGLQDAILSDGRTMGMIDEFQDWLCRYADPRAGGGTNALFAQMKTLYTNQRTYITRRRTSKSSSNNNSNVPPICYHPGFVLYGTGTLQRSCQYITETLANDGFFARLLIVANEDGPQEKQGLRLGPLPENFVAALKHIAGWREPLDSKTPNPAWWQNRWDAEDEGCLVSYDQDAEKLHAKYRELAASYRNKKNDGPENALWQRAAEKMTQLEMILAVSRNPWAAIPSISRADVAIAKKVVWHCTAWALDAYQRFAARNDDQALRKKIIELLRQSDRGSLTKKQLYDATGANKTELDSALDSLEDAGAVRQEKADTSTRGRPQLRITLTIEQTNNSD